MFEKYFFSEKKSSLFLNIKNTQFDQGSPVQTNPDKKNQEKSLKNHFSLNQKFVKSFLFSPKKKIILS